MKIFFN